METVVGESEGIIRKSSMIIGHYLISFGDIRDLFRRDAGINVHEMPEGLDPGSAIYVQCYLPRGNLDAPRAFNVGPNNQKGGAASSGATPSPAAVGATTSPASHSATSDEVPPRTPETRRCYHVDVPPGRPLGVRVEERQEDPVGLKVTVVPRPGTDAGFVQDWNRRSRIAFPQDVLKKRQHRSGERDAAAWSDGGPGRPE